MQVITIGSSMTANNQLNFFSTIVLKNQLVIMNTCNYTLAKNLLNHPRVAALHQTDVTDPAKNKTRSKKIDAKKKFGQRFRFFGRDGFGKNLGLIEQNLSH